MAAAPSALTIGWWLAEGSRTKAKGPGGYDIRITQKDVAVLDSLALVSRRLGFKPHIYKHSTTPQLSISSMHLYAQLEPFGKGSGTKCIPPRIKNLPSHRLALLFDCMCQGDGMKRRDGHYHKYATVSRQLAHDVMEVAVKLGYGTSVVVKRRSPYQDLYLVAIRTNHITPQIVRPVTRESYDGIVHCITVPNHLLLAGRNGKLAWCGNSHLYEAWSLAIGQVPVPSYAEAALGHSGIVSAADVLAWEAAAKVAKVA